MSDTTGSPAETRLTILGAGPAGVGAAYMLAGTNKAQVTVLERADRVGGNSGTFMLEGVYCDFGSHRLHPASDPHLLQMIKDLLGENLLWRPRHGRIRLKKRWIHFPLKPVDLLLRLPKTFAAALAFDMATKPLRSSGKPGEETFASILHKGLGSAMCNGFYYPYMTKLWALPPEKLAVTLAHRRVSGNSISKIIGKVLGQIPGLKKPHTGGFYYPKHGFGEISEALKSGAEAKGTEFTLNASVSRIEHENGRVKAVSWTSDGAEHRRESDVIWSTLPITNLASMMDPPPPPKVMEAVRSIRYRGMILIYLVLEQDQFTEFDAHYFPEIEIPISRLSEPKNYSATNVPKGATILCAELPCDPGEPLWALSDDELGAKLVEWLNGTNLKVTSKVRMTKTRRLSNAYPVYDRDFERHLDVVYKWVASIKGLLTFGRQGLFAHDNTHHALAMADGAVDCLGPNGTFDDTKWQEYLKVFETHVVED